MAYWLYRLGAVFSYYAHEAIGYRLFSALALLAYLRGGSLRRNVTGNMRHALGPNADERCVQSAVREAYRNLAWGYYELFHTPAYTRDAIRSRMTIEGIEFLDDGVNRGKGVLLTTLHYGNTEVLLQVPLLYPQWQFIVPVERMRDERIFALMRRLRESQGMHVVPVDEPLKIVRRLKQNCIVGLAIDRDVTGSGVLVDFFGAPARLPDGPVRLAMRTGAALLPGYGQREGRDHFHIRILPPIELQDTGNPEGDIAANMRRLYTVFESIVRERPGQWMAFNPLWPDD